MGTGSCLEALLLVRELRLAGVQRRESLHADYANLKAGVRYCAVYSEHRVNTHGLRIQWIQRSTVECS